MFYILFIICLYVATCIGISMFATNLKNKPPNKYIRWFPILRIYLSWILFKKKKYKYAFGRRTTLVLLLSLTEIKEDLNFSELLKYIRYISYRI